MRQMEGKNRKLKRIVADLSLYQAIQQAVVAKNALRTSRELVSDLMQRFGCSKRLALRTIRMSAYIYLYVP